AAKQIWPIPSATPRLSAPSAAAIAVPPRKAPARMPSWLWARRSGTTDLRDVPPPAALEEQSLHEQRGHAGEHDRGQVDAEMQHRASPVFPVAERRGDADVRRGGN